MTRLLSAAGGLGFLVGVALGVCTPSLAEAVTAPSSTGASAHAVMAPSVIVIGVPGLRWADVGPETTPHLWELAQASSLGQMTTRSARSRTCPADGWVQLGTGNRARYPIPENPQEGSCQPFPAVEPTSKGGGTVEGWDVVVAENNQLMFDAVPGLLGQTLSDNARCSLASGPGSALGSADMEGVVAHWVESPVSLTSQSLRQCSLTAIGVEPLSLDRKATEMTAVDDLVESVNRARPANSLLMVLGVSDLADERASFTSRCSTVRASPAVFWKAVRRGAPRSYSSQTSRPRC